MKQGHSTLGWDKPPPGGIEAYPCSKAQGHNNNYWHVGDASSFPCRTALQIAGPLLSGPELGGASAAGEYGPFPILLLRSIPRGEVQTPRSQVIFSFK
jgi:hypothetical protein